MPGVHRPSTATSCVANTAAYDRLDEQQRVALEVAAREISVSLRQDLVAADGEYITKFAEAGVEIIRFDPEDVIEGRQRAVDSWARAAGDDALAVEMMESQKEMMQELGIHCPHFLHCTQAHEGVMRGILPECTSRFAEREPD